MGRIAALPAARQRRRLRGERGASPHEPTGPGADPVRYLSIMGTVERSGSRSGPASATACARRSTRRRSRPPPASRPIPWARSSTTRASIARPRRRWASKTVDTLDDVDHGAAVVIRAHGVRPDVMERATQRASRSSTAPAPGSSRSRRSSPKLVEEGYTIVLLGTPKHPEVVGLLGFAPDAIVVDEEEDWERRSRAGSGWR